MTKEKKRENQKPVDPVSESFEVIPIQDKGITLSSLQAKQFIEVFIKRRIGALKKLAEFDKQDGPDKS